MSISASQLRQDVYRLLDEVLGTAQPLEIERKGRILRIVPEPALRTVERAPWADVSREPVEPLGHLSPMMTDAL